jgi:MmyB-like transcription regulator ligand binding domain
MQRPRSPQASATGSRRFAGSICAAQPEYGTPAGRWRAAPSRGQWWSRRRRFGLRRTPTPSPIRPSSSGPREEGRDHPTSLRAINELGRALYAPVFDGPARRVNLARFVFLDQRSREFYGDWDGIALDAVGSLRAEAGRDSYDRALTDLVGELSTRSEQFRLRWAGHDVRYYRSGVQPFHHPVVGDLSLSFDALELPADPGQTIVAYTAEADSSSGEKLNVLASWSATVDRVEPAPSADRD